MGVKIVVEEDSATRAERLVERAMTRLGVLLDEDEQALVVQWFEQAANAGRKLMSNALCHST